MMVPFKVRISVLVGVWGNVGCRQRYLGGVAGIVENSVKVDAVESDVTQQGAHGQRCAPQDIILPDLEETAPG